MCIQQSLVTKLLIVSVKLTSGKDLPKDEFERIERIDARGMIHDIPYARIFLLAIISMI